MQKRLSSFLATQSFETAWQSYQDWYRFQRQIGRDNEVGFAGCRIDDKDCWRVFITQALHDERVQGLEYVTGLNGRRILQNQYPSKNDLAVKLAVVMLTVLL